MADNIVKSVETYRKLIEEFMNGAARIKQESGIEPPLTEVDCHGLIAGIQDEEKTGNFREGQQARYAAIETVFRENFYDLLASTPILDPGFVQVWNLLDVVSILSDRELCEPGLIFWLVEELLDSQTIHGCRIVFDYLESRRERITSRHFRQKNLIILRCCNELLRRLSRAEDTVFCGRVFIFLFQSFPLGDKSSVNLRGEYHIENVTIYDSETRKSDNAIQPMDLDADIENCNVSEAGTPGLSASGKDEQSLSSKTFMKDPKGPKSEQGPDLDKLYPFFWSLQANFSSPTRLFEPKNFALFKSGIAATMECFQHMSTSVGSSLSRQDDTRRGMKRKRTESATELSSNFNPKYLTNRDLFDLEVHDIAFRRHVLVQALILLDFLLSLTASAKSKLTDLTNKSVLYSYTLSAEDEAWATATKSSIASYLQQGNGNEGKFYYRMVDTVLSRDKNWVRWKAENCPSIDKPPVNLAQYLEAQRTLLKICDRQHLPAPPGAKDFAFLSQNVSLESLKDPSKYTLPSMESFYRAIKNDELDAELGTEEDMQAARNTKESTLWRALRASRNRFNLCEKIENGKNLEALLGEDADTENVAPAPERGDMETSTDS